MRNHLSLFCSVLLAAQGAMAGGISAFVASGVYDNEGEANSVDREAANNIKSLAEFKKDVAAAFQNNTGGVITFDRATPGIDANGSSGRSGNYPAPPDGPADVAIFFGASQACSLDMSADLTVMKTREGRSIRSFLDIWQGGRLGYKPISGPLIKHDGSPGNAGAFLTPGTDIADQKFAKLNFSGGQIRQLGLTVLSAECKQVVTVTACFSGGQSEAQTESLAAGCGLDDVFFFFAAPPGQTIVSVSWRSDVVDRPGIDDLAFIFSAAANARCTFIVR